MLKKIYIVVSLLLFFGGAFPATANDTSYAMGVASAKYAGSVFILQKLSSTECGYAIKKQFSYDSVINEITEELTEDDRSQVIEHLSSTKFEEHMNATWNDFITQPLKLMQEDGIDSRTACGILIGGYVNIYQQAKNEWEHARLNYRNAHAD